MDTEQYVTLSPGIGKSRLVDELAVFARARGMTVLVGACLPDAGLPPYWPWAQALRPYLESLRPKALAAMLRGAASLVATALPDVAALLPGLEPYAEAPEEGAAQTRFLVFDALSGLLLRASEGTALLVVLEDLHWADEMSARLLVWVARLLERSRLMVIGTYRPEDLPREHPMSSALGELARVRACEWQTLKPLSEAEVIQYCERVFPPEMPAELSKRVYERTEGNPLFVRQMTSYLIQEGAAGAERAVGQVPEVLRETIRMRLERLTPGCRELLETAAILGMEFHLPQLEASVEPSARDSVGESIQEALGARILQEDGGRPGRFRFVHALVRDAVVEGVPRQRKARLHARVGEALESLYGADAEAHAPELALHFAGARDLVDPAALVRYCRAAGEQAMVSHAAGRALEHFERALAALRGQAEDPTTTELALGRARALVLLGRPSEAVECARRVFRTYRDRGDTARALGIFETFSTAGTPEAVRLLEEALALTRKGTVERARVLRACAFALIFVGSDGRKGMDMLEEALDIARQRGSTAVESSVLHSLVYTTWYHLRIEEFRRHTQALIELADELGDAHQSVWSRELMVGLLSYEGRLTEARAMVSAMHRAATRSGLSADARIAFRQDAHLARVAGEWQRARDLAESLLRDPDPCGAAGPGNVLPILIDVEYLTGHFDAGKAHLERLLGFVAGAGRGYSLAEKNGATCTARAAYLSGELWGLDQAKRMARDLLARPLNPGLEGGVLAGLAHMALAENDGPAASECYDRLTGKARLMCEYAYPGLAGAVARCAGRLDDAVACLEQARSRVPALKPSCAWICYELGEALLCRSGPGDAARARQVWDQALGLARELGMPPLEHRVEERLSRLAGNGAGRLPAGLSPREVEVVRLVALGKTNKEIAFDLHISEKTVQSHLAGIFGKIGAANRAEAATFAAHNGLV